MGTKVTSRHPRESGLREEEPEDISTKRTKMLKSQGKRTYWSPRQSSAGQDSKRGEKRRDPEEPRRSITARLGEGIREHKWTCQRELVMRK